MYIGGNFVYMYFDLYWKRLGWGGCKLFYLNVFWLFYFFVKWFKFDFFFLKYFFMVKYVFFWN